MGLPRKVDLWRVMVISAVLRGLLVAYGEWQDAHMEVRYTDVDYLVFSDAAALMAAGSSPFRRSTYRYSPLLAALLVPNSLVHPCWGKLLFSAAGEPDEDSFLFPSPPLPSSAMPVLLLFRRRNWIELEESQKGGSGGFEFRVGASSADLGNLIMRA